jgi:hypothetical protein
MGRLRRHCVILVATIALLAAVRWPAAGTEPSGTVPASAPASSTSVPAAPAVVQPDIAVSHLGPLGSSVPVVGATGFIGTGMQVLFGVAVMNLGSGTPHTSVTITLSNGLAFVFAIRDVDAEGGQPLACSQIGSAPTQIKCPLGGLPHFTTGDPLIQIQLTTTAQPPVGTIGTVTVAAAPDSGQGTDSNPANNSASTSLTFSGIAALSGTLTPAATQIPVGAHTTVTVTIHNAGPQPAVHTVVNVDVVGNGDKSGKTPCCPLQLIGFSGAGGSNSFHGGEWDPGTIAPGSSVTGIVTVRARIAGTGNVVLLSIESVATNPNCPDENCTAVIAAIRAVPVQPAPASTRPPPPTAVISVPPPLATTGSSSRSMLALSVLFLIAGAMLTVAGRRRAI